MKTFEVTVVSRSARVAEVRQLLANAGYSVDQNLSATYHLVLQMPLNEVEAGALEGFLTGLASVVLTRTPIHR